EVLDEAALPVRLMACTPCCRREAGSAGRDTRGLLRTHEFDKVEILAYATPDPAPAVLEALLARAEGTVAVLGLVSRAGVIAGLGAAGGDACGFLVLRLPGPPGDHPLPPGRRARHRGRAHAARLGARRAPGVGGDRGDLPPAGRIGAHPRGAPPLLPGRGGHT